MQRLHAFANRALSIEIYAVTLTVLASIASERLLPVAAAVAVTFWLLRAVHVPSRQGHDAALASAFRLRGFLPLVVLLLSMVGISVLVTAFPALTVPQGLRVVTGVALFYAIVNWARAADGRGVARRAQRVVDVLIALALALAALAPFVVDWSAGPMASFNAVLRGAGTPGVLSDSVNANVLAGALVILLPLPLARLLFAPRASMPIASVLAAAAAATSASMLVLTQSRGAYLAAAAAVVALVVLRWRAALWLVAAACVAALAALALAPGGVAGVAEAITGGTAVGGLSNRLEIWSRAAYLVRDFSFTGIGMGAFTPVTERLYPLIVTKEVIPHAHNLFLQVGVDLGVPGLLAWLGLLGCVLLASWRAVRSPDATVRAIGAGLLASQVAMIVHGLLDAVTWGMVRTAPLVWALWGVAAAASLAAMVAASCADAPHGTPEPPLTS